MGAENTQTAPDELSSQVTSLSATPRVVLPPQKKRKNSTTGLAVPAYQSTTTVDSLLAEARKLLVQARSSLQNKSLAEVATAINAIDRSREEENLPSLKQASESWGNPTLQQQISTLQQTVNVKCNAILSAVRTTATQPQQQSTYANAAAKAVNLPQPARQQVVEKTPPKVYSKVNNFRERRLILTPSTLIANINPFVIKN